MKFTCQSRVVGQIDVSFFVFVQLITVLDAKQTIGADENAGVTVRGVDTVE